MKKLNQSGFAHWILPALVIVVIALIGVKVLTGSHADSVTTDTSQSAVKASKWSGWTPIGVGNTIDTPSPTALPGSSSIDVYFSQQVPANSGSLFHDIWNGTSWSGAKAIDGQGYKYPAALAQAGGITQLFAVQSNNFIYQNVYNGSPATLWKSTGQVTNHAAPAVTSLGNGQFAVYSKKSTSSSTNPIYQNVWNGNSWSGWTSIGGNSLSGPAAATTPNGTTYLFIRGADNSIYENVSAGKGWSGWNSIGGSTTTSPAVVSMGAKKLKLFIREADNSNYENTWNGKKWLGWQPLGGTDLTPPAQGDVIPPLPGIGAVSYGKNNNSVAIYVVGTDGKIYQNLSK